MTSVVEKIFAVFDAISTWISGAVTDLIPMFWDSAQSQLTFMGTLAVIGLGIGVVFLLIGIIQRFLKFGA